MSLSTHSRSSDEVPDEYWIGRQPAHFEHTYIPDDKYWWERRKGSQKYGLKEEDMADEPDLEWRFDVDQE